MRLCRYQRDGKIEIGFFQDDAVIPLPGAARAVGAALPDSDSLLPYLPGGDARPAVVAIQQRLARLLDEERQPLCIPVEEVKLQVPVARPGKLLLLAGNYAEHIREGGGLAAERAKTFPYVFMKPATTTLTHPGDPVRLPPISPDHIDWEIELGVIIGKRCQRVSEKDALNFVAGYTVVNDVSDRRFRPNPNRVERPKDAFFDWLHGKWHDTFCPMGPCVLPADELSDPQTLRMTLKVNGHVEQDGTTATMIFPVAAVIEFISSFVTLEPGDIISTGTISGTGVAKNKFLRPGDQIEAHIEGIGTLRNPVR